MTSYNRSIEPFSRTEYYEASGADFDHLPCTTISGWGESDFEINVLFRNDKYEIWFLNLGTNLIPEHIVECLISREMEPSETHGHSGYFINKDTDYETIEFIKLLCAKLKHLTS